MRCLASILFVLRASHVRSLVAPRALLRRRMAARAANVEVEEKFAVSLDRDAFSARVASLGGAVTSSVSFRDEYFDTADLALTTRDTWLRRRDGAWELKIPHGERRASGGETTVFKEVEEESAIVAELAALGVTGDAPLPFASLAVFADFTTRRDKYALDGVKIDVDDANYGIDGASHKVLELEVMTNGDDDDVARARREIAAAAGALGCEPLPAGGGGKLETFLRRFRPDHARAIGLL